MASVFHEINAQLFMSKNTNNIVYVYQKFGEDKMTPEQIMFGFKIIATQNLERTQDFWKVIVPLVKKQLSTLDRETVSSMMMAIEGAGSMQLQDNEFWEIFEQKFVDEGLHRYFTLEQLVLILCHLGAVGRGSDDMVEIIEKTLIKHRKGLTEQTI